MLISEDFCLKTFTTFGIEVKAEQFIVVTSITDLQELYEEGYLKKTPRLVLGEGSNILFTGYYPGLILSSQMRGKEIVRETKDEVWIKVNSGEYWLGFVEEMVAKGYGGIENLCLIPGKVGAVPVQNIGAYGVEVKDVIESVEAFDTDTGKIKTFTNSECIITQISCSTIIVIYITANANIRFNINGSITHKRHTGIDIATTLHD